MDKKVIFIGLGVVALGGLAFFLFRKKGGAGAASTRSADVGAGASAGAEETYDESYDESLDEELGVPQTRKEMRQERRQTRRDCRAEAKSRGLRGKKKRQFKRECKAAGGVNADFTSEQADFAFNGYGNDIDNVGF